MHAAVRAPSMMLEREAPRAHLIVDDFFSPNALRAVFAEIRSLQKRLRPGLIRDIGHDGQSVFFENARRRNKAVWIHDPSKTLQMFREQLWSGEMLEFFENAREPLFQIVPNCSAPHLQVSSYMTGDHYDFHEDEGAGVNLTAIVFLAVDSTKIRGGDLVLAYRGEATKIRFKNNRLVLFPSKTPHRVTRVTVHSSDSEHARLSLQCWLTYGQAKVAKEKRAPKADCPTFLLAEESILAAAQAMNASSAVEQTPEDLYWGAFYLSRILASNLKCLVDSLGILKGARLRIRRGAELEVYMRGEVEAIPVRAGFLLAGPKVESPVALSLFVEKGRGVHKALVRRIVPPGADEKETATILRGLLARV